MPEVHAKLSASISKRWMLNVEKGLKGCPGSIIRGMQFDNNDRNAAADTGTAAHEICEWGLNEGKCPTEFLDHHDKSYIDVDGFHVPVTEELVEGPVMYCETIWRDIEELEEEHLDEGNLYVEEQFCINDIFKEGDIEAVIAFALEHDVLKVSASKLCGELDTCAKYYDFHIRAMFNMFGTNDASFIIPGVILSVYDYKNGRWPVDVENNTQFLYYAIGAAFKYNWDFEEVEMIVIQPNDTTNEEKVRRWRITRDELKAWVPIFRQAALDTIYEYLTFTPSEDSCHYCPARGNCEDQEKLAQELCAADFDDFTEEFDEDDNEIQVINMPALGGLTYDQIRRIADNADFIKNFVDSVLGMTRKLVEEGDESVKYKLGRKLVHGSSRRSYKMSDTETIAYLEDELLLDRSDFMVEKLIPMGKLEKIIEKPEFDQVVHRPEPPVIMVSLSDERPEVQTGAASDFDDDLDDLD